MKFGERLESVIKLAAAGDLDVSLFVNGAEIMRRPEVEIDHDGDIALYFPAEAPNYQAYSKKA